MWTDTRSRILNFPVLETNLLYCFNCRLHNNYSNTSLSSVWKRICLTRVCDLGKKKIVGLDQFLETTESVVNFLNGNTDWRVFAIECAFRAFIKCACIGVNRFSNSMLVYRHHLNSLVIKTPNLLNDIGILFEN